MITTEKTIVGNLVGTYAELVELMALADRGLVNLHTREYKFSQANDALHDLHHGRIHGRAVLIPDGDGDGSSDARRPEQDAEGSQTGARACWRGTN